MASWRRSLSIFQLASLLTALVLTGGLAGCSLVGRASRSDAAACQQLANSLTAQEDAFVQKLKTLRRQHISLQEYDRQMVELILERRSALQATKLTELSVTDEVGGCSGMQLEDMRRKAQKEMVDLRAYLADFTRASRVDSADIFIDQY